MTGPDGKPMTARVRTTELLHRSNGKWRYVIDKRQSACRRLPRSLDASCEYRMR